MKIKFLLMLSLCSVVTLLCFGQEGYKQNLSDLATINFPAKPKFVDTLGQQVIHYADENAGLHYLVIVQDLSKEGGFQMKANQLNEFYEGNIEGVLKVAGGKVVSKKAFEIKGLKGLDVIYTSTSNPNLPDLRFKRLLYMNGLLFSIDFWTFSAKEMMTQAARERFFNSLNITADSATLTQETSRSSDNAAYGAGYIIGRIVGTLFVLAIIAGIIFLIIRLIKRK